MHSNVRLQLANYQLNLPHVTNRRKLANRITKKDVDGLQNSDKRTTQYGGRMKK